MKHGKRAGAYWGLHFDFHASDKNVGIGTMTDAAKLGEFLDAAKPDYIQVDTKGHPGYSSYFTKAGDAAPGMAVDHLKILREETKKRGIALIAHHSGLYDHAATDVHPDWCVVNRDGTRDNRVIDPCSPYADQRLIPQLKELAGEYGFDGVWVDGDNWVAKENYNPENLKKFYAATGFTSVDEAQNAPSHVAFRQFCRQQLREYIRHYAEAVKAEYPDFEICSNGYSHHAPEEPLECLDFLSSDLMGKDLRAIPRIYAIHGKPWDVMRWGMMSCYVSPAHAFFPNGNRHVDRLKRDAAFAVSLGGGYQIVNSMTPQGEIRLFDKAHMAAVGAFLEERKPYNFGSLPIHSIRLLISDYDQQRTVDFKEEAYKISNPVTRDVFDVLLDTGYPVGAVYDYHILQDKLDGCRAIVLPETKFVSQEQKEKLLSFAQTGGSLVLCGVDTCRSFAPDACGEEDDFLHVEADGNATRLMRGIHLHKDGAKDLCTTFCGYMDFGAPRSSAVISYPYGKGKLILVGYDIFSAYTKSHHFVHRDVMAAVLREADPAVLAYLEDGIHRVDIIPAEQDGRLIVNCINTSEYYYDVSKMGCGEVPPVYDITVAIRADNAPVSVKTVPENSLGDWFYDGTHIHVKLQKIHIHTAIVLQ